MKDHIFNRSYFTIGRNTNYKKGYQHNINSQKLYFRRIISFYKINSHTKVLDVGCAYGYFLSFCDQLKARTYGLDISSYALQRAAKITKADLRQYDANATLPFANNYFDLISAFDIIEHLSSPHLFLLEVKRLLRRSGVFVLATPNLNSLQKIFYRNRWHGFTDLSHKYLFTPESIAFLLKKAGFAKFTITTPFYPLGKISKLIEKSGLGGQIWVSASKN